MPRDILDHCCPEMKRHLEAGDLHFHYEPKFREFGITYADDGISVQRVNFCPWCGSALPNSLRDTWFDEIEAMGIDPHTGSIPAAYQTDEWWMSGVPSNRPDGEPR